VSAEHTRDDLDELATLLASGGIERRIGVASVLAAVGLGERAVRCGRFEVKDKLGEGAMGVVYRAWDPELRRHVALKVLRGAADPAQQERLRREARGLARHQHPGIVQVLGLGHDHGRTWIAMELVPGVTLAKWSAMHPPGEPGRLELALDHLRAVGEALAAAHAVGLVHRDVKPANVLVREDGTVKLADFGLVRVGPVAITEDVAAAARDLVAADAGTDALSRAGAIVGTPRYMSPEQHTGGPVDARSDQFSFAVTAWEVLTGTPPFSGRTLPQIFGAIEAGRIQEGARRSMPAALRPVLRRALSIRPERRFASMDALLRAWSRAVKPRGLAPWIAGFAAAGAVMAAIPMTGVGAMAACDGRAARQAFAERFDAERRQTIARALAERGAAWSAQTEAGLAEAMTEYGERWSRAEAEACALAEAGDAAKVRAHDRLIACRGDAVETTDALLARLESPSQSLAAGVLEAMAELPDPRACGERDEESRSPQAAALRTSLARAEADRIAGRQADAALAARRVADQAGAAGLDRLRSEALYVVGRASAELSEPSTLTVLDEAYTLAMAHDDAALAFGPAIAAVAWLCVRDDPMRAREWQRHATVAASRSSGAPLMDVELARAECMVLQEEGKLAEALTRCEEALEVLDHGEEFLPSLRARIRRQIESLLQQLGRGEEALALAVELRDDAEARLGPDHPTTVGLTMNVGAAAKSAGDLTLAEASFRRAEAGFVAAYGGTHRWVVSARLNLAGVRYADHDYAGSEAVLQEALEATAGREDSATARVLHNLAETRRKLGRPEEALDLLERVRRIEDTELPAGHLQIATTHHTRGNVYLDLGRLDEAERELHTAQTLWDRSGRTEHVQLEESLARLERLRREAEGVGAPPRASG
jgi:tetratricopeptide (TPR) repeat protein